jgi:hypothetical protein
MLITNEINVKNIHIYVITVFVEKNYLIIKENTNEIFKFEINT